MTDQELEQKLAKAVAHSAPNDLDAILARCGEQNGSVIEMRSNKNKHWGRWAAAACLALVLAGGGAVYAQSYAVASIVSVDVNPSIELKVNRKERVLSCQPLNDRAREVLADMDLGADLEQTKLDVAVNAIVGALVKHGYLDQVSSAILISVEDRDQQRAARLQQELTTSVGQVLQLEAPSASLLSQTVDSSLDGELSRQARENSISTGKAYLIQQAMALNSKLTFEGLARLSVEELKELVEIGAPAMPIGRDEAARIVAQATGTETMSAVTDYVDADLDDAVPHYEVELYHPTLGSQEYYVDAWTGAIIRGDLDWPTAQQSGQSGTSGSTATPPAATGDIGREGAKAAALKHAGLTEGQVSSIRVEQDWDDGRLEYEIEFWAGDTEYQYTIAGKDGAVLSSERETVRSSSGSSAATPPAATRDIGREGAKAAALKHAGLTESQVSSIRVEQDWDDGRLEYEVEFQMDRMEYSYTLDGSSGAVLEYEKDLDD